MGSDLKIQIRSGFYMTAAELAQTLKTARAGLTPVVFLLPVLKAVVLMSNACFYAFTLLQDF